MELLQRLAAAEAAFTQQQQTYEAAIRRREGLANGVAEAQAVQAKAEAALAQAETTLLHTGWFRKVREVLQRCQVVLSDIENGRAQSGPRLRLLRDQLGTLETELASETGGVGIDEQLLRAVIAPLQKVAERAAITQERQRQLAAWEVVPEPSRAAVEALEVQVKRQGEAVTAQNSDTVEQRLAVRRQAELEATKVVSGTEAAAQRAQETLERLEAEIARERGTSFLQALGAQAHDTSGEVVTEAEVRKLQARLEVLGEPDPLVVKEYEEARARLEHLQQQLADVQATHQQVMGLVADLEQQIQKQFASTFTVIQKAFARYFVDLFGGGEAQLELVEAVVPTEGVDTEEVQATTVAGVEIWVQPPGKRVRSIRLLSGGEKALAALALLLAILEVQRPPFLVLDEVDAALDEGNSQRFADLLREKRAELQCVVITHNRSIMAVADVLYGITMGSDGVSQAFSVRLSETATAVAMHSPDTGNAHEQVA